MQEVRPEQEVQISNAIADHPRRLAALGQIIKDADSGPNRLSVDTGQEFSRPPATEAPLQLRLWLVVRHLAADIAAPDRLKDAAAVPKPSQFPK